MRGKSKRETEAGKTDSCWGTGNRSEGLGPESVCVGGAGLRQAAGMKLDGEVGSGFYPLRNEPLEGLKEESGMI